MLHGEKSHHFVAESNRSGATLPTDPCTLSAPLQPPDFPQADPMFSSDDLGYRTLETIGVE